MSASRAVKIMLRARFVCLLCYVACLVVLCPPVLVWAGEEEEVPVRIEADHLHHDATDEKTRASGNVRVRYREVFVSADELEIDNAMEEARLFGNVHIQAQGQVFTCEEVFFDLKHTQWKMGQTQGEISPEFFRGGAVEPVYIGGRAATGDVQHIDVNRGLATTCNLPQPHYSIRARRITVTPQDKLVAKDVALYIGERRIASLHTFSISLRPETRRRIPLIPFWGSNDIEGYFLKTTYEYMSTDTQLGTLYLDFMQRRGTGVGVQQEYETGGCSGSAYLYYLQDQRSGDSGPNARLKHHQKLAKDLVLDFNLNASRNDALFGYANNSTIDLSLSRNVPGSTVGLGLHQQQSQSDYSDITSRTANLQWTQKIGATTTLNIAENYRYFDYVPHTPPDTELLSRWEVVNRGKLLDWSLRVEQREDLDGANFTDDDRYYFLERSPEITFQTDSVRTRREVFGMFPSTLTVSLGKFTEYPEETSLFRANLNLRLQNYVKPLSESTSLTLSGAFQQSVYSDNTAQYVVNYRSELTHKFGRYWSSTLSYSRQAPFGFTPFRFDYSHAFDSLDSRLSYNWKDRVRLHLSSGYDFESDRYRDAILRLQLMPNNTYYLSVSTGYDINNREMRDIVTRLRLFRPKKMNLDLTTRYNPDTSNLRRINASLDWRLGADWRIQALSGYNGFTRSFDYNQVKINRAFHCWQTYLTYDQQRKEVRFDLALKAFPFFDTRFGVGRSGELLDASTGELY